MIKDLIVNVSLLISFISIASHILKEEELVATSPIRVKLVAGLTSGILGITLIYYGFNPANGTIVDFRNIVLAMASIYGGPIPVIICSLMIAIFRITYYGITLYSVAAVISTTVMCIVCIIISKQRFNIFVKWVIASIFNTLVLSTVFAYLLYSNPILPKLLMIYWISSFCVAGLTYKYVNYSLTANKLFRKLKKESTKDFLTGLNNVRSFDNLFNEVMRSAKEKGELVSILMIDIDFFKKVNDTYGHHEGDVVLKELGNILVKNSRSFDIVSRNGGEEFTVILLDCPPSQAMTIAERIRAAVEAYDFILSNDARIKITISIGVANYPETTDKQENLIELSDAALYTAKRTGRNKVCLADKPNL